MGGTKGTQSKKMKSYSSKTRNKNDAQSGAFVLSEIAAMNVHLPYIESLVRSLESGTQLSKQDLKTFRRAVSGLHVHTEQMSKVFKTVVGHATFDSAMQKQKSKLKVMQIVYSPSANTGTRPYIHGIHHGVGTSSKHSSKMSH